MRYLVRARVKAGREGDLLKAIEDESLGQGSVAEGEYLRNMNDARLCPDQTARWVEVCYCPTPLQEERPYWEEYFELLSVKDAHSRRNCRQENGTEPWACCDCDCTKKLEAKLRGQGNSFLETLHVDQFEAHLVEDRSIRVPQFFRGAGDHDDGIIEVVVAPEQ